jgi:hypothetical protein
MNERVESGAERVAEALRRVAPDGMPPMSRARVLARLGPEIEAACARQAVRPRRWWPAWTLVGMAAAGLLLFAVLHDRRSRSLFGARGDEISIVPYLAAGGEARAGEALLGARLGRLEVPAGVLVSASAGPGLRLSLEGPAALTVETSLHPGVTALSLARGRLRGELMHGSGRTIEIRIPGATAFVVGTVFAIDAAAGAVSVREGTVLVRDRSGRLAFVPAGTTWRAAGGTRPDAQTRQLAAPPPEPSAAAGTLMIDGAPAHARIFAGDVALGPAPVAARWSPGDATLIARAEGHADGRLATRVIDGKTTSVSYALATPPAPVVPAPLPTPAVSPPHKAPPGPYTDLPDGAEEMYRDAEAALSRGEVDLARRLWREVARRYPDDELAGLALLELAREAGRRGDLAAAGAALDQLGAAGDGVEAARQLRCQLAADAGQGAADCWRRFRSDFPGSAHDGEALAWLIDAAYVAHDCTTVARLADDYLTHHPDGAFAAGARERKARCK